MTKATAAIVGLGALAGVAIALWLYTPRVDVPATSSPEASATGQTGASSEPVPTGPVAIPAPEIPADLPPPKPRVAHSPEALKEMDEVQFMLRDFRVRLGGNPAGTNAEIMKELMGDNRAHARFVPSEGVKLNEHGELLDRWDSPYFFHQISMKEMELRSSGPDRQMWTADDIVVN
jgi:hypothetical protein